jgi:uncharacterized membrane protein
MRPSTKTSAIALGFALIVVALSSFTSFDGPATAETSVQAADPGDDAKSAVLKVLQLKCNTCHARQNPGKVFTPSNMNTLASKINEQVFVKKRMPRGKRLTNEEYTTLQAWLTNQNIN